MFAFRTKDISALNAPFSVLAVSLVAAAATVLVSVLLASNEVFMDDWFIEASADGFFGNESVSLFVIGPNALITGLIHLLSLTGVRLFWLHIIIFVGEFASLAAICFAICCRLGFARGLGLYAAFSVLYIPLVGFFPQFTTSGAFFCSTGVFLLLLYVLDGGKRGSLVFSCILFILGFSMRESAAAFAAVFLIAALASLCLVTFADKARRSGGQDGFAARALRSACKPPVLTAVLVTAGLCAILSVGQAYLMESAEGGFAKWNAVRVQLDDYEIPPYEGNEDEYSKAGLTREDYDLLKSWNYADPDYFTTEKLEEILSAVKAIRSSDANGLSALSAMKTSVKGLLGSPEFFVTLIILVALSVARPRLAMYCVAVVVAMGMLYLYFVCIGRLIWRTEWPIYTTGALATLLLAVLSRKKVARSCGAAGDGRIQAGFLYFILAFILCLVKPPFGSESIADQYSTRVHSPVSVYQYILSDERDEIDYATTNRKASAFLSSLQDKLVIPFMSSSWLQQYPLYGSNIITFPEKGSGSNYGCMGQYFVRLYAFKSVMEEYGIRNPVKELPSDNVVVVGRSWEIGERAQEVCSYLESHYYSNVDFSLYTAVDGVAAGVFLSSVPDEEYAVLDGDPTVIFKSREATGFPGFSALSVRLDEGVRPLDGSYVYVKLTDVDSGKEVFAVVTMDLDSAYVLSSELECDHVYDVALYWTDALGSWRQTANAIEITD